MGAFRAIDIAATGANMSHLWLDVIANNLANVNTVRPASEQPFRAQLVFAQERTDRFTRTGDGVQVVALLDDRAPATEVFAPDNPLADDEGRVVLPVVDLAGQMADLIVASRSYQVNLEVIRSSREAYEAALRIGRT